VSTELSIEKDRLGTGGALRLALPRMSGGDFFVLNGDIISKIDLSKFKDYHFTMGKVVSIVAAPLRSPYGIVTVFNGLLQSFVEKPELPNWINGGIYIFSKNAGEFLPEVGDLETEVFPLLSGEISVYMSKEMWIPIDTTKDLREAERLLGRTT
jgi:NDP-sugar pyrophosphorylase family protein